MATAVSERRTSRRMIPATVVVGVAIAAILVTGAVVAAHEVGEGDASAVTAADVSHAGISQTYAIHSPQLRTAVGWVDGLASGRILSSDVTGRLRVRDPKMAGTVLTAWSDLNPSSSPAKLLAAVGWVEGLASGRILSSDVTGRLRVQDPKMAATVMAAWSDLNPTTG